MKKLIALLFLAVPLWAQTYQVHTTDAQTDSALVRGNRYMGATEALSFTTKVARADTASWLPTWADIIAAAYITSVDSATAFLSIGDAVSLYLPIGQRPKFSVSGSAAVNDSIRFVQGTGMTITNSGNAFTFASSGGGISADSVAAIVHDSVASYAYDGSTNSHLLWKNGSGEIADVTIGTGLSFVTGTLTNTGTTGDSTRAAYIADSAKGIKGKVLVALDTTGASSKTATTGKLYLNATGDTVKVGTDQTAAGSDSMRAAYKADRDGAGNVIASTYLTAVDSTTKFLSIGDAVATYQPIGNYLTAVDSATAFLSIGDAVAAYLPIGQRPKFSVSGTAAFNDSMRFVSSTGITITSSGNVFTVTGTDTTALHNQMINRLTGGDTTSVRNYSTTLYDGKLTAVRWCKIVIDSTKVVADSAYKITIMDDLPYAITIDSIKTRGVGTTSLTPRYHYGTDISAVGTRIILSPAAVTASTTMNKVSSFDNASVAAGNAVWMVFQAVTTAPKNFNVTIYFHRTS